MAVTIPPELMDQINKAADDLAAAKEQDNIANQSVVAAHAADDKASADQAAAMEAHRNANQEAADTIKAFTDWIKSLGAG